MKRQTVFITGATGFLGRNLVRRCVERGFFVRALVRDRSKAANTLPASVEVIEGDLFDAEALWRGARDASLVIHAAARLGGWGDYELFRKDNVEGTANLLAAIEGSSVRQFVFVSSASVYGRQSEQMLTEDARVVEEDDPYCRTKIENERTVRTFCRERNIRTTIIRPGIIYGPGDTHFLPRVIDAMKNETLVAFGRKNQGPPLVYVDDVVEIILAAVKGQRTPFEVYNAVAPDGAAWEKITQELGKAIGTRVRFVRLPYWIGYTIGALLEWLFGIVHASKPPVLTRFAVALVGRQYYFDSTKAKRLAGFSGFTPIVTGIRNSFRNARIVQ